MDKNIKNYLNEKFQQRSDMMVDFFLDRDYLWNYQINFLTTFRNIHSNKMNMFTVTLNIYIHYY